ncbi:hypothetical protein EJB05_53903, partial [Eragrostis curvula]
MDLKLENIEKQSDHVESQNCRILFGKEMVEKIPQQQPWHTNASLTDLGILATAVDKQSGKSISDTNHAAHTSDCDVSSSRKEVISVMPQSSSPTVWVTAPVDKGTATYPTRPLVDDPRKEVPSLEDIELFLSQDLPAS